MNNRLATALAITSVLFLGACSSSGSSATPSSATEMPSSVTQTASPAETTQKPTVVPADHNANDMEFRVTTATQNSPYGIDYAAFGKQSDPGLGVSFSAKEVEVATRTVMDRYHKLRTDPRLFKTNRTVKSDAKILSDHDLRKVILDDWKDAGGLFTSVPAYHFLSYKGYVDSSDNKKLKKYPIDSSKVQKVGYQGATVEGILFENDDAPGLGFYFTESAEYSLENGGNGFVDSTIQLYARKASTGKWVLDGLFWQSPTQTLKDSRGAELPE